MVKNPGKAVIDEPSTESSASFDHFLDDFALEIGNDNECSQETEPAQRVFGSYLDPQWLISAISSGHVSYQAYVSGEAEEPGY